MKRVKLFTNCSQSGLEELINNWLNEGIYEIVDVKFAVNDRAYYALVIFKYSYI